jgi:chitinase
MMTMQRGIAIAAILGFTGALAACGGKAPTAGTVQRTAPVDSGPTDGPGGSSAPGGGGSTGSTSGGAIGGGGGPAVSSGFLFSPYKDVTISANWNTSVISTALTGTITPVLEAAPNVKALTWAFATGECGSENWGGIPGATLATANVQAFATAGRGYVLSTGGAAGSFTCGSDAGFSAFLDRYASPQLVGVDFDIEAGQTPAVIDALVARVKAAQANPKYAKLRFSFTLATLGGNAQPSLGTMGVAVMDSIKKAGLTGYLVNLMTMDYGSPTAANCTLGASGQCDMGKSAVQAATALNAAYGVPFSQIELTPMIGGNDTQNETFTLDDVATVTSFAREKGLAGIHTWSLDRDKDCPAGSASPICNSFGSGGVLGFNNKFMQSLQ